MLRSTGRYSVHDRLVSRRIDALHRCFLVINLCALTKLLLRRSGLAHMSDSAFYYVIVYIYYLLKFNFHFCFLFSYIVLNGNALSTILGGQVDSDVTDSL